MKLDTKLNELCETQNNCGFNLMDEYINETINYSLKHFIFNLIFFKAIFVLSYFFRFYPPTPFFLKCTKVMVLQE